MDARSFLIGALFLAFVTVSGAVPAPASALTVAEIQAQIQSLLSRIASFGQPAVQSQSSVVANPIAQHRICSALYRNLSIGMRGDDVLALQEFLQAQGYFYATPTGYYGRLTAQAVARWQAANGISAVGAVGPLTRERIRIWCGGSGGVVYGTLNASPTSGSAPLTVNFSYFIGGNISDGYMIEFGDGTTGSLTIGCGIVGSGAMACPRALVASHTYAANGTYAAKLRNTLMACAPIDCNVVGSVTIYVGGSTADPSSDPRCRAWYDGCNDCSREYPGGPAACTLRACIWQAPAYCKAYFDSTANKPPVISSFSGPTTLNVNLAGTWTIQASDPENGPLNYRVSWGDEYLLAPMMSSAAEAFVQTTTFTHAYSSAGTYTVTIIVRDSAGQEARTSTTVRIDGTPQYCTMEYAPVCGQPPEPACRYTPPYCMLPTPAPQTYGNRCLMNQAGATFLYEGQCQSGYACTADAMQCPNGTWVGRTGPNCQFVCPGY
ncbi:peptidoglycan-binding protein [Candidatus Kaiserbacteria bacterium]|nr:peptidoglycan-binding protein [Candidatus Kaiserbacteria bacterium]